MLFVGDPTSSVLYEHMGARGGCLLDCTRRRGPTQGSCNPPPAGLSCSANSVTVKQIPSALIVSMRSTRKLKVVSFFMSLSSVEKIMSDPRIMSDFRSLTETTFKRHVLATERATLLFLKKIEVYPKG